MRSAKDKRRLSPEKILPYRRRQQTQAEKEQSEKSEKNKQKNTVMSQRLREEKAAVNELPAERNTAQRSSKRSRQAAWALSNTKLGYPVVVSIHDKSATCWPPENHF